MKMQDETKFLRELETLISNSSSVFDVELLDTLENVVKTRLVPLRLNLAGRENRFTVICNENPYDIVYHDITDYTRIQSLSPAPIFTTFCIHPFFYP